MVDPQKLNSASEGLQASLKKTQGPQMMDTDSATRVFRTMVNDGVSSAFTINKQFLAQVFDMLDRLETELIEKNEPQFPGLSDLYTRMEENHINLGGRGKFPDRELFAYYLAILATEEPPFLHTIREFLMVDGGLRVKTSYVGPNNRVADVAARAYKSAVQRTVLVLNQERKGTDLFLDWPKEMDKIKREGLEAANLKHERLDHVLKGLFLRPTKDRDFNNLAAKINTEIQQWLYMPLIQQLRQENVVVPIGLDDLRATGRPEYKNLGNLLYLNNPARLRERYIHLCEILIDSPLNKKLDPALLATAEKNRGDSETFFEHCGPMAEDLLRQVKSTLSLAQPFLDVAVEAGKLAEWFRLQAKQQQAQTELSELQALAEKIKKFGTYLDVRNERKLRIQEKHVRFFLEDRVPGILATTIPYMAYDPNFNLEDFQSIIVIYKDRINTARAIDTALEIFERVGDDTLLHVIEKLLRLDRTPEAILKQYVAPVHLVRFREALNRAYIRYLPFFQRLLLLIFSSEPNADQVRLARQNLLAKDQDRIQRIKDKSFRSEKKEATREVKARARRSLAENAAGVSPVQRAEVLARLGPYLDESWERGQFPTRPAIVQNGMLGTPIVLNNFLKVVDKGDPSNEIVSIPLENGAIYATRAYLEKYRTEVIAMCEKVIREQLDATGSPQVDDLARAAANRKRRTYTAVLQHVQKLF